MDLFDFAELMRSKTGDEVKEAFSFLKDMSVDDRVEFMNNVKLALHEHSPFKMEPVDCVIWVKVDSVCANDYNPNSVAPPEMELLRKSIHHDGYTQPVVTWNSTEKNQREVIDGFHRTRVCKELDDVRARVHGYLPVVTVQNECTSQNDRMASTIRHNRARGKHNVTAMSDIVTELKNRNWKNARISKELGMDEDEVLRLCQITGLEGLFSDGEFSDSWEAEDSEETEYIPLEDDFLDDEAKGRTVNTSDPNRIFHTFDKWECVGYNFYGTKVDGMKKGEIEQQYADFLSNSKLFAETLKLVISEWKHSCEQYLTNTAMNRIAWLGQASVARKYKIPAKFCGGFNSLTNEQQNEANEVALVYLNKWLVSNNLEEVTLNEGLSLGRQMAIY
jgi:ParB-like chromosome segregation protein Spo0J